MDEEVRVGSTTDCDDEGLERSDTVYKVEILDSGFPVVGVLRTEGDEVGCLSEGEAIDVQEGNSGEDEGEDEPNAAITAVTEDRKDGVEVLSVERGEGVGALGVTEPCCIKTGVNDEKKECVPGWYEEGVGKTLKVGRKGVLVGRGGVIVAISSGVLLDERVTIKIMEKEG